MDGWLGNRVMETFGATRPHVSGCAERTWDPGHIHIIQWRYLWWRLTSFTSISWTSIDRLQKDFRNTRIFLRFSTTGSSISDVVCVPFSSRDRPLALTNANVPAAT